MSFDSSSWYLYISLLNKCNFLKAFDVFKPGYLLDYVYSVSFPNIGKVFLEN